MEQLIPCTSDADLTQAIRFLLQWGAREHLVAQVNPPGPVRQGALDQIQRLRREVNHLCAVRTRREQQIPHDGFSLAP